MAKITDGEVRFSRPTHGKTSRRLSLKCIHSIGQRSNETVQQSFLYPPRTRTRVDKTPRSTKRRGGGALLMRRQFARRAWAGLEDRRPWRCICGELNLEATREEKGERGVVQGVALMIASRMEGKRWRWRGGETRVAIVEDGANHQGEGIRQDSKSKYGQIPILTGLEQLNHKRSLPLL